jgi:hypothetical protein
MFLVIFSNTIGFLSKKKQKIRQKTKFGITKNVVQGNMWNR